MTHPHLEDVSKRIDKYWNEHDGTHFYKDELKDFILSEITTAYNQGREDTKNHVYVADISLDYVSKLNLLGKITEVHAKEINEIIAECIEAALREERERIVKELINQRVDYVSDEPSGCDCGGDSNGLIADTFSTAIEIVNNKHD